MDDFKSPDKKGWERRGIYDDPKLAEITELYRELGFSVRCEAFTPEMETGCSECMKKNPGKYKVLYTKIIDVG